jgi:hypothetical protein
MRNFVRNKYFKQNYCFVLLLLAITIIPTVAYYINYPQVELNVDTVTYLSVVRRALTRPDFLIDVVRLPGYPLFIIVIYMLEGRNNLAAVSNAQAILFLLMTLEIYLIALLIFQRAWLAFLVGVLVGTNSILLSYTKPIMSEGLAAFLFTTLALAIVCFIRARRVWTLWFITLSLLLLIFTRPEWMYLPMLLFIYLFLVVMQWGDRQQLLQYSIHAVFSILLIYSCIVAYTERNGIQNHSRALTSVVNLSLMGKILQYKMENEVSAQEKPISQRLEWCISRIDRDPFHVVPCVPQLIGVPYAPPAGEYAKKIILNHPGEFLFKSFPLYFSSLTDDYDVPYHIQSSPGPFYTPLSWLKTFHQVLYQLNAFFPACVVVWLLLLCWRPTALRPETLIMGVMTLLLVYGVIITTLAGYRADDYMRFHIVFDPLLILAIWGSFLRALSCIKSSWQAIS